ncbi:MAG: hypothetical protein M1819_001618 [Sarea resinae]|nr:MAG: hypothetical protein M1819_001618 [Sarea resinae]
MSDDTPGREIEVPSRVTLQVGGRRFTTTIDTLAEESAYFAAQLSGSWGHAIDKGNLFIDADPDLFEHVLRYLRRRVLPIFYDRAKGHDRALYGALLEEAKYFQIPRLEKWLEEKTYLQAVTVKLTTYEVEGLDQVPEMRPADMGAEYHPFWKTTGNMIYTCPRGIFKHKGDPSACGRACRNAKIIGRSDYVEEEALKTLVICRTTVFNHQLCTAGR